MLVVTRLLIALQIGSPFAFSEDTNMLLMTNELEIPLVFAHLVTIDSATKRFICNIC